jgi:hypothetical protein
MKRHNVLVATALGVGVLASGCGAEQHSVAPHHPNLSTTTESVAPINTSTVVHNPAEGMSTSSTTTTSPEKLSTTTTSEVNVPSPTSTTTEPAVPSINLGDLPATLPAPVVAQEDNAVAIRVDAVPGGTAGCNHPKGCDLNGSGFQLTPTEYVIAGHTITQGDDAPYPSISACANVSIDKQSTTPNTTPGRSKLSPDNIGQTLNITHAYGTYRTNDTTTLPDLGILIASPTSPNGKHYVPTTLSPTPVSVGEDIFEINYQNTSSGLTTDPDAAFFSSPDAIKRGNLNAFNEGYANPAIHGAVAIGTNTSNDIVALEIDKSSNSYGVLPNKISEYGASGSLDVNSEGQVVGIDIQTQAAPVTLAAEEKLFGLDMIGLPSSQEVTFVVIQPITPKLIGQEALKAAETAPCNS